jgi:hypothetical protein
MTNEDSNFDWSAMGIAAQHGSPSWPSGPGRLRAQRVPNDCTRDSGSSMEMTKEDLGDFIATFLNQLADELDKAQIEYITPSQIRKHSELIRLNELDKSLGDMKWD